MSSVQQPPVRNCRWKAKWHRAPRLTPGAEQQKLHGCVEHAEDLFALLLTESLLGSCSFGSWRGMTAHNSGRLTSAEQTAVHGAGPCFTEQLLAWPASLVALPGRSGDFPDTFLCVDRGQHWGWQKTAGEAQPSAVGLHHLQWEGGGGGLLTITACQSPTQLLSLALLNRIAGRN